MQGHLQAEPRDNCFSGLLNRDALAPNTPQGIKGFRFGAPLCRDLN